MSKLKIAVDAQSGDFGPEVVIQGVLEARAISASPFDTFLCGDKDEIARVLEHLKGRTSFDSSEFTIEHCPELIRPGDNRSKAWKTHAESSIVRCVSLQKEKVVQASVSAGDTGVLIGAALFILGRSEDTNRPALAALIPTAQKQKPVLLLDVGANLNCRSEHLVSFAQMGYNYVKKLAGVPEPTISLLNIGKEPVKGPRSVKEASKVLQKRFSSFKGYIEGDKVLSGETDVVVCDGFTGNVLLKACESFYTLTASVLKDSPEYLDFLAKTMEALNPENYGAVPFLGVKGIVMKAHGGSSIRAIRNAVMTAIRTLSSEAA
ncbi:phosphate acyltransferase PlsX [Chitinispirillales bacterium ANBcel5]|uniref:phosphate acyltransferase PlsX n=1 Tax=Cellulosispirillum alkaliphilum TaxID=3039283 RepID=UPI002A52E912|nr:phosphate acyltransferase PlsX [Chitinispirillales bacterium ANBcel5]